MTILFGYDPMVINSNTNCDTNDLLLMISNKKLPVCKVSHQTKGFSSGRCSLINQILGMKLGCMLSSGIYFYNGTRLSKISRCVTLVAIE